MDPSPKATLDPLQSKLVCELGVGYADFIWESNLERHTLACPVEREVAERLLRHLEPIFADRREFDAGVDALVRTVANRWHMRHDVENLTQHHSRRGSTTPAVPTFAQGFHGRPRASRSRSG
jgi:hypothetical protein